MLIDYHLHNHFSSDSESKTKKIAEKAVKLGINEICLTNHVETFPIGGGKESFSYEEASARFAKVKKDLEETQKEFTNLQIKFGIELEYVEEWMDEMNNFVNDTDFDFLIGSVHEVDGVNISNALLCDPLYSKTKEQYAYSKYFESMMKMVEWGNFSVVGHFDVFKKGGVRYYGPFEPEKYKNQIIPILELMRDKGIGIELNTSCIHRECKELFPHPTILKWCKEIGIEHYTLGSDGHKVGDIGQNFEQALQTLKNIGINTISTYSKRKPTKFQISEF
ncbi:histidinol-phosphatase [Patescibacteria group bacterium]|nr:histidinol-phosphatase [Patescibacteria group bacterium]